MLLTISDETSVKKLVSPRYQTTRPMLTRARAVRGVESVLHGDERPPPGRPSVKIRAQSIEYMRERFLEGLGRCGRDPRVHMDATPSARCRDYLPGEVETATPGCPRHA